ncbi:alpha/beta fold hydrolase [Roseateles sp.]|uniref:bifunctional 4-carboxymuconolactone decarboxylase/3-oxoadipate enol-lactonase PcaCD n=1 Tax=Roseateles sp. TaxID=1971397 RepID=UPI0025F790A8|nr:alpha/beta fold hydrolase [Roseateles sp.]MBV8035418.1 alpha/beta fold hydrolase [Roseateles sp.]
MPVLTDDDRRDDFDHGLARRREVLGDVWVRRATLDATAFNADFQDLVTRHAWDAVWNRPGLPTTTRRLLVLAFTMAQGRWEEFDLHCRAALAAGLPPETLREVLIQGSIYAGMPAADTAFKRAAALLAELGIKPEPAPLMPAARPRHHTTFSRPQLAVTLQGEGDKVPVLLAHPPGLNEAVWQGLAARLAALGHPTLRYDLRGHGRSPNTRGDWGLAELAEDAARLVAEWGCGPVVMIGLSLGGLVAQHLAATRPGLLRGLVLAHCDSHYPEVVRAGLDGRIDAARSQGMAAVAETALARYLSPALRATRPDVEILLRDILLAQDPAAYALACAAVRDADLRDALTRWAGPTLVIGGALDGEVPPERVAGLAAVIPGARLCLLDGASQLGPVEQPAAFDGAVVTFLGDI